MAVVKSAMSAVIGLIRVVKGRMDAPLARVRR